MPNPGLAMHSIRELLRLKYEAQLTQRQIAHSLGLGLGSVSKYLRRARAAGLTWPLPGEWTEDDLARRLALRPAAPAVGDGELDCAAIHQELQRKGVTRLLLWEEYAAQAARPLSYSRFCVRYREWKRRLKPTLRQTHVAGEKLFVDYCGQTVAVIDQETGEARQAQVFVAVLGASNYTYAEATWTQALPDWVGSHVRAFEFFGGAPRLVVPDNLKSAVRRACRYEPLLTRTYQELLEHYATAALPARPYKPRDKAKVENAVQVVERWILARLRKHTFFSLVELNVIIRDLLNDLNRRPFKKLPGCRRSQYEALDRPALKPLPAARYQYAEWRKARVHIDYHVEVAGHYYSVPHQLLRQQLDVRLTALTVEFFHRGQRVAAHPRSPNRGRHTTTPEHLPKAHRAHLEWSPTRFLDWAGEVGAATRQMVEHLLNHRPHPEMGYRSCLGLLSLARRYGVPRLEAACQRALAVGALTRKSVLSILEKGLDSQPLPETPAQRPLPAHDNIRGAGYYH